MIPSAPEKIKQSLHTALANMGTFEQCALLNYPSHRNLGDHLIWLGDILYLTDVLKTKINYAVSAEDFSGELMDKLVGQAPILLHGGGNLGDIWYDHQVFRERIISRYQDRPIIILPQTIYFKDEERLKKAAEIFNSHPNLTLFARDNHSHEFALKHFSNCHIFKSPDMAFQMVGMPGLSSNFPSSNSILYHLRTDAELNQNSSHSSIGIPNLVVEDWVSYKHKWLIGEGIETRLKYEYKWNVKQHESLLIRGLAQLYREAWQRGLATPIEWRNRQKWLQEHPYNTKFETLYNPSMHRFSLSLMHSGIYQFKKYRFVITNRLHGHILCTLLGIPHIFLPNSYYKNEAFYETWTHTIPFCRFVKDTSQIKYTLQELMDIYSDQPVGAVELQQ